ncbi:hydroxysteroid dehydrogenase [Delitschia confertaspora ATCC 74209]|uniref:Hydroxysteroid dehydrogenase n=1 Tax=Delitschia confertaspora ATCC 74209 TaxID=1513339 RepID=A0A9P4MVX9_9PLEO|nr:hydroxysteroid dehydrogenase [Delitschia confertaspora ATCC 74209]
MTSRNRSSYNPRTGIAVHYFLMVFTPLGTTLVVGGCGFLGFNIVQQLLDEKKCSNIVVLDMNTKNNRLASITYHNGDITQGDQVQTIIDKVRPQVLFHTASPPGLARDNRLFERVNINGTRNLIKSAQQVGTVKAFVYTSSSSVIHDHYSPIADADESMPVLYYPQQPEYYSHTKAVAEEIVLAANRVKGVLTAAIRPATIFGIGDHVTIANMCKNAISGRARNQLGDGRNLMDATYGENCAYAHILAAEALLKASASEPLPADKRVEGEAFFVRNEERYEFWELQRFVAGVIGHPVKKEEIRAIPRALVLAIAMIISWLYWIFTLGRKEPLLTPRIIRLLTSDRTFDIGKIKTRLRYRPRVSTEEELRKASGWYMREVYGKNGGSTKLKKTA